MNLGSKKIKKIKKKVTASAWLLQKHFVASLQQTFSLSPGDLDFRSPPSQQAGFSLKQLKRLERQYVPGSFKSLGCRFRDFTSLMWILTAHNLQPASEHVACIPLRRDAPWASRRGSHKLISEGQQWRERRSPPICRLANRGEIDPLFQRT